MAMIQAECAIAGNSSLTSPIARGLIILGWYTFQRSVMKLVEVIPDFPPEEVVDKVSDRARSGKRQ